MRLGLDFGTTNSAIALFDGQTLHTVHSDPANDNPHILPSLMYIERSGQTTVGAQAATAYLKAETGRPVQWVRKDAGEMELTVASWEADPITFYQTFNVLVDAAANGRLFQSIKRALFNNRYEGTQVFERYYRVDDLIAMVLGMLKTSAERHFGEPCTHLVMGRPVTFSDNPAVDSRAESILLRAAHLAGFHETTFELEPIGVAHLQHVNTSTRQTVFIFDFGGGTLDLTLARIGGPTPPEIIASKGVLIGGDDLDRRIMAFLLPYFGGGDDGRLPPDMNDKLLAWHSMPELSQPHYMERISLLKKSGDTRPIYALEKLVTHNLGFQLFEEIKRVKAALSTEQAATLCFDHDPIHIQQKMTRRRFEKLISKELTAINNAITQMLREANMDVDAVDMVLRTGGSSQIPAVHRLLADLFGEQTICEIDPLVSVVGGFAVRAFGDVPRTSSTPVQVTATDHDLQPMQIGMCCYTDREFVVDRIPNDLKGLPTIFRPNHIDNGALDLALAAETRVYVAHEYDLADIPAWLRDFQIEPMTVDIVDEYALISRSLRVYSQVFLAGRVRLGANHDGDKKTAPIVSYLTLLDPVQ